MLTRKLKAPIGWLRRQNWTEECRNVGQGIIIAGVVTPALSEHTSLVSGFITAVAGLVLIMMAKLKEK